MRALEQEQEPRASMVREITDLGNNIKTLKFRLDKTDEVIARRDRQALERHKTSTTSIVEAVDELKDTIEEKKFAKGESEAETSPHGAEESKRRLRGPMK